LRTEFEREHPHADVTIRRGGGVSFLWSMLRSGQIDHHDLLEVIGELNHRQNLALEWARFGRKKNIA
jgi:hypothetical protein